MRHWIFATAICVLSGAAQAEMQVEFGGDWDGETIPDGQQCEMRGGNGATPPMQVSGVPDGASMLLLYFNDIDYRPMATGGAHGVIGFDATGPVTDLPSVPGMTADLPDGVQVITPARSTGRFASDGYLPPCSSSNRYAFDLVALDADGQELERLDGVMLGRR